MGSRERKIYYKLTTPDSTTASDMHWKPGVWNHAKRGLLTPCSDKALHGYTSPELATLLNAGHGGYMYPLLWECEFEGEVHCDGTKVYGKKQRVIREIKDFPNRLLITPEVSSYFGLLCAVSEIPSGQFPLWEAWIWRVLLGGESAALRHLNNLADAGYVRYRSVGHRLYNLTEKAEGILPRERNDR